MLIFWQGGIIANHFTLTQQEFNNGIDLFRTLEVVSNKVIDKNHQELSQFLKKQHKKLILVAHPDKGGSTDRFNQIHKAYQELKKYIEPLELGNPCVKVDINAESNGHLTAEEFHYRRKLFEKFNITQEEAVGKSFEQLYLTLKKKDISSHNQYEYFEKLIENVRSHEQNWTFKKDDKYYRECATDFSLIGRVKDSRSGVSYSSSFAFLYLEKLLLTPSMSLLKYIFPLLRKQSLIREDKAALIPKFLERKNHLLSNASKAKICTLLLLVVAEMVYCIKPPAWLTTSNSTIKYLLLSLFLSAYMGGSILALIDKHYIDKKYADHCISTDSYIMRKNCIMLCYKFFVFYPMPVFFTYLLARSFFVSNGFDVGIVAFGALSLSTLLITEVLIPIFSKSCEIYVEKQTTNLLEEDPKHRVKREIDLLKCYVNY
ncbi:MAG: J domain-containing protein [Wolbachia endosymbiont of Xenopsylla cheopis]